MKKKTLIMILLCVIILSFGFFAVWRIKRACSRPCHQAYHDARVKYQRYLPSGDHVTPLSITTEDGIKLAAIYIKRSNPQGILIVCHGYWQSKEFMYPMVQLFEEYDMLLFDLRAHGDSEGDLISFGVHEIQDIQAVFEWVKRQPDLVNLDMYGLGVSLGGAILLHAAAHGMSFKKLIIDSTYASFDEHLQAKFTRQTGLPGFFMPLARPLAEYLVGGTVPHPIDSLKNIQVPILFIHSCTDIVVPIEDVHTLYQAAKQPKKLLTVPDAAHAKIHTQCASTYAQAVREFLT